MYKIYINETPLILLDQADAADWLPGSPERLVARYPGKAKFILNYVDMLEKSGRFEAVVLYADDLPALWDDFASHFQLIEAAGGVVHNEAAELLFIFRRGYWDLPKGKIDAGESIEEAAVREVQEETGLAEVHLQGLLHTTYHTYRDGKNRRVLKRTYWYRMHSPERTLIPQMEEDIEHAVWMTLPRFRELNGPVYRSVCDVLDRVGEFFG